MKENTLYNDPSLLIFTLCIWLVTAFLLLLSVAAHTIETFASNGGQSFSWMLGLAVWGALIYSYGEFVFHIVYEIGSGKRGFPVLSLDLLRPGNSSKKFIKTLVGVAIAYGLYSLISEDLKPLVDNLVIFFLALFTPACIISIGLSSEKMLFSALAKSLTTALYLGIDYWLAVAAFLALGYGSFLTYHIAGNYFVIALLPLIYGWNLYVAYLGQIVCKRHRRLGLETTQHHSNPREEELQAANNDIAQLATQLHQLSTGNKLKEGLPRIHRLIAENAELGIDEGKIWAMVWLRVEDWHDRDFLCELAKHYISFLLSKRQYKEAATIAKPMLYKDRFLPFSNLQDCFTFCDMAIEASDAQVAARALEYARVQHQKDRQLAKVLFRLGKVYLFNLDEEVKAKSHLVELLQKFPEAADYEEVQSVTNLAQIEM